MKAPKEMEVETLTMREAPKRYGMSASGMIEGYECEDLETAAGMDLAADQADAPSFGGFLKRNNYQDRI